MEPGEFAICHEGAVSSLKKKIGLGDMETGDPRFDENMLVTAKEPSSLRAFLNSAARSFILKLDGKAGDFLFTDRELIVSVPHGDAAGTRDVDKCVSAIKDLIRDLINGFANNFGTRDRYIDLVRSDDVPGVRLSAMRELSSIYPSDEKLVPLFRQCLEDDNFDIRFEAARFLGEEGMAHLSGTLAASRGLKTADRVSIIREIGLKDYRKGIQPLLTIYNSVPLDERIEILKVLEKMGDDSCCGFLLKRLGLGDAGERSQLVDTLAACGNAGTVRRLRTMAKVVKRKVIRSVNDDIADRIVARLEKSGGGGRLSMPETSPLDRRFEPRRDRGRRRAQR